MHLVPMLAVFLWLLSGGVPLGAQSNWDRYRPRTLREIIATHSGAITQGSGAARSTDFSFSGDQYPSRVRMVYTGRTRPLPSERRAFLTEWGTTYAVDSAFLRLFETEMLFLEADVEYWIPIQTQLVGKLNQELLPGNAVDLFTIWAGARSEQGVTDWIFLVNSFQHFGFPQLDPARWVVLVERDDFRIAADRSTVEHPSPRRLLFWTIHHFSEPHKDDEGGAAYDTLRIRYELDCRTKRFRMLRQTQLRDGQIVARTGEPSEWDEVEPATVAENAFGEACQRLERPRRS